MIFSSTLSCSRMGCVPRDEGVLLLPVSLVISATVIGCSWSCTPLTMLYPTGSMVGLSTGAATAGVVAAIASAPAVRIIVAHALLIR